MSPLAEAPVVSPSSIDRKGYRKSSAESSRERLPMPAEALSYILRRSYSVFAAKRRRSLLRPPPMTLSALFQEKKEERGPGRRRIPEAGSRAKRREGRGL